MAEGLLLNEMLCDPSNSSAGPDAVGGCSVLDGFDEGLPPVPNLGAVLDGLSSVLPTIPATVPDVFPSVTPPSSKDLFAEQRHSSWNEAHIEARCDFTFKPRITRRSDLWFISVWQKSLMGRTLTDIKGDDAMIPFFAREVGALITEVLGSRLREGGYALVTSPKRRHKEHNFATLICLEMACALDIPFYEDAAFCQSRHRLGAGFDPGNIPAEKNVIVFDDFVTTGQTLRAMADLLLKHDKNLSFFTGINNKL